jgi:hypothetical protein
VAGLRGGGQTVGLTGPGGRSTTGHTAGAPPLPRQARASASLCVTGHAPRGTITCFLSFSSSGSSTGPATVWERGKHTGQAERGDRRASSERSCMHMNSWHALVTPLAAQRSPRYSSKDKTPTGRAGRHTCAGLPALLCATSAVAAWCAGSGSTGHGEGPRLRPAHTKLRSPGAVLCLHTRLPRGACGAVAVHALTLCCEETRWQTWRCVAACVLPFHSCAAPDAVSSLSGTQAERRARKERDATRQRKHQEAR